MKYQFLIQGLVYGYDSQQRIIEQKIFTRVTDTIDSGELLAKAVTDETNLAYKELIDEIKQTESSSKYTMYVLHSTAIVRL